MYYKFQDKGVYAYKFNTAFISWFFLRLVVLTIGGLVFLIYSANDSYWPRLYCNRYEGLGVDMDTGLPKYNEDGVMATQTEINDCKDSFRTAAWFVYLPSVIF